MKVLGKLLAKMGEILIPASLTRLGLLAAAASNAYRLRLQDRISPLLLRVLVIGEDRRFHVHAGFDPVAIAGALWRLIKLGRLSGASTIEQQFVRVLTGDRERTVGRKAREIILACALNIAYEKADIAGMYLAVAYFGWRMNGVEGACGRLSINLSEMTLRQAASLVARLKYPEPQDPTGQRSELIARRTEYLLAFMSTRDVSVPKEVGSNAALLDTR